MAVESSDGVHMEYRWVNDAHHRAERVPKAHWDTHKAELGELYHEMSLDNLMDFMKEEHGFAPTRRQYTYQFEKWGFAKYRKETLHPSGPATLLPDFTLETVPRVLHESPAILENCEDGKRHRSMQSTRSSASALSSPLRPRAKRSRRDPQFEQTIGTSSHAELVRDTGADKACYPPRASESPRTRSLQLDLPEISTPEAPLRPDRENLSWHSSLFCASDLEEPSTSLEHCEDEEQRPEVPTALESVGRISKTFREITAQRPVSAYTTKDMDHIQLAAEYLEAMGYEEDAFSLYALLLQRLHEDCPQDKVTFLHAVINYSQCVSTPGHCEIIQHHLRDQARRLLQEAGSPMLYQFLIEMALAEICSRKFDTPAVKIHLQKAHGLISCVYDFQRVIKELPQNDRCLDLVLYHSLRRFCDPYAENLLPGEENCVMEFHAPWKWYIPNVEQTILYRVPGPFELRGSKMGNPCIRLCLQWCRQKLGQLKYVPEPWTEIVSSEMKERKERIAAVHQMFLFTYLWETWINDPGASSLNTEEDAWMSQAHSRLGVNATELIMITCAQIVHESGSSQGSGRFRTERKLIDGLRQAADRLLEQSDDMLARYFLNAFVQYRTLGEGESQWLKDLRQRSRTGTMGQLERALHTTFSQTREITAQLTQSTRRLSTQVAGAAKHATMTSSLRSSDLSLLNFRKVKESMGEKVMKLKEQPSLSSVSLGDSSPRSRLSFWTVSRLSQTMERTSLGLRSTGSVA